MAKKVLIVDDELAIRITLREFIRDMGYSVDLAESADEAIEKSQNEHFDLIATDLNLPKMNGIDMLRHISLYKKDIRAIIMTGELTQSFSDATQCLAVLEYLHKPFSRTDLQNAIDRVLMQ